VSRLEPGAMVRVEWRGRVIFIVRRTEAMLSKLGELADMLADPNSENIEQQPEYARKEFRSIRPEYLVVEGVCTHFGCAPVARFELGPADLGADWPGGFFCPCHGSKFDLAGRVFKSVPAPSNLVVPPHRFVNETTILIGVDEGSA
jgi:ubiquinol-cytochrome c reductase iron-sulfur subunit